VCVSCVRACGACVGVRVACLLGAGGCTRNVWCVCGDVCLRACARAQRFGVLSFFCVEACGCGTFLCQCVGQVIAYVIVMCFHVCELDIAVAVFGSRVSQRSPQVLYDVFVLPWLGCGRGSVQRVHGV